MPQNFDCRVFVVAGDVMVRQQKLGAARLEIVLYDLLQAAKLLRIGICTGIEADDRRPVSAGAGGQHGVNRRRRFAVASQKTGTGCGTR
jgi:hypothetical protein